MPPGSGTQQSPITIDDSDDSEVEILHVLTPYAASPAVQSVNNAEASLSRSALPEVPQHLKANDQLRATNGLKRRRSNSNDQMEGQPPMKQGRPLEQRLADDPTSAKANTASASAKAMKKKNKREKDKRLLREQQEFNLSLLRPNPKLVPRLPPGALRGPNPSDYNPFLLLPFNQTPEIMAAMGYSYTIPTPATNWPQAAVWPTSASYVSHPADQPPFPAPPIPPKFLPSRAGPTGPVQSNPSSHHPTPIVTHPPVSIGMKPDQNPNSKHGIFKLDGLIGDGRSYNPNPARTLVMEQLPKTYRNPEVLHAWGRNATGHQNPIVKVLIDPKASKALLEFATAELARKAWDSPRLGADITGLKSHQLKGKPREDLIRVWWYRVEGIGADEGVGEIEEGEIEGDTQEPAPEPAPFQETKKQRKARLLRERQEQARRELQARREDPSTNTQPTPLHVVSSSTTRPLLELSTVSPMHVHQHLRTSSANPRRPANRSHHPLPPRPPPPVDIPIHEEVPVRTPEDIDMDVDSPDDDDMDLASPAQSDAPVASIISHSAEGVQGVPAAAALGSGSTDRAGNVIDAASAVKRLDKEELEARERQLQEEIARARLELAQRQVSSSSTPQPMVPVQRNTVSEPEKSLEARLRERVLQSRKAERLPAAVTQSATTVAITATILDNSKPPVTSNVSSLEDLADSFIKQALGSVKPHSKSPQEQVSARAVPAKISTSNKAELERLEYHLSQTKLLMQQLLQAKTKQEKDMLRAKLAELDKRRNAAEGLSTSTAKTHPAPATRPQALRVPSLSFWPTSTAEQHILILSDDEDDGDDDDDDDDHD